MIRQIVYKIKLAFVGIFIGLLTVAAIGHPAAAQQSGGSSDSCAPASIVAFPHWYDGICEGGKIKSPNEVGGIGKFVTVIALNIVTILLMVVGYVSLAFIIWGGFKYMYSGDNASGTAAARKTILNAVIGLVLSIMSVAIVKVVAGAIA